MKRLKFFLLLVCSCLLFVGVFAQAVDGIIQPAPSISLDPVGYLVSLIPVKYQGITFLVVSTLLLWEQFLARTNVIKANSTEQMITGWFQSIYAALKPKADDSKK